MQTDFMATDDSALHSSVVYMILVCSSSYHSDLVVIFLMTVKNVNVSVFCCLQ